MGPFSAPGMLVPGDACAQGCSCLAVQVPSRLLAPWQLSKTNQGEPQAQGWAYGGKLGLPLVERMRMVENP